MSGTGGPIAAITYMLPPMTRTAEAEALEAWLADEAGVERILIAEGRVEPKMALGWILAQQWAKAGLVRIVTEPADGRDRRWIAERLVCGMPGSAAGGGGARRSGRSAEPVTGDGEPVGDCILRHIRRAANFGKAAPSLAELAAAADLKSAANADYYVQKLAERGRIAIEVKAVIGGKRRRYQILDRQGAVVRQTEWGK